MGGQRAGSCEGGRGNILAKRLSRGWWSRWRLLNEMCQELLHNGLEIAFVRLRGCVRMHLDCSKANEFTIAESKSSARMRILMSWSLILRTIVSWYSVIRCGWVGTIFAIASKAIYFTVPQEHQRWQKIFEKSFWPTILILVFNESSELWYTCLRQRISRRALEHSSDDACMYTFVEQWDRRRCRNKLCYRCLQFFDQSRFVWR